jgi:hypothetical protein
LHLDAYLSALEPYRGYHPDGWVALYRILPTWFGLLLALLGAVLLPFGSGRAFRLVAAPLGALVGFFLTPAALEVFHLPVSAGMSASVGAVVLFVAGVIFPPVVIFFAAGLPLGLLAGKLVGSEDFLLGFVPGLLLAGALGAVFHRQVAAVASAAAGGWLLVIGLLATLHRASFVPVAAGHPFAILAAAGLFALAGAVYQIAVLPSPEQSRVNQREKERLRKEKAEQRALEERWAKYSEKR